jgi:hypothetical protein
VEEVTAEAEKHGDRSVRLAALVAEARGMIEQARAEQAGRARAAAEAAAAAAAVKAAAEAAERLRLERRWRHSHTADAERRNAAAGGASAAGQQRRLTGRTRMSRCAWCAWTRPSSTPCYRACTCARARRAPSGSWSFGLLVVQCVASPSSALGCSPRGRHRATHTWGQCGEGRGIVLNESKERNRLDRPPHCYLQHMHATKDGSLPQRHTATEP